MYAIQYADLPRFAEMQKDLAKAEMFRKKADEWAKQHGIKYDLETCNALLLLALLLGPLAIPLGAWLVIERGNPYNAAASFYYASAQQTRAAIAKANGWQEVKPRGQRARRNPRRRTYNTGPRKPAPQARRTAPATSTLTA